MLPEQLLPGTGRFLFCDPSLGAGVVAAVIDTGIAKGADTVHTPVLDHVVAIDGSFDPLDTMAPAGLRLVENLGKLREPERLGGWLATTARRECLRFLRTAGRSVPVDDDAAFDRAAPDAGPEIDTDLLRGERDAGLWRAFGRTDRCQRLLRILTADPPPSYDDISETLEMPIGSIGPTRQRCLDRLRAELVIEGIASA